MKKFILSLIAMALFALAPTTAVADTEENDETVYVVVEKEAVSPYSRNEIMKMMETDIRLADPYASPCRVMVKVVVEKDGSISNPEVLRSSNNDKVDAYALKVVMERLPKFTEPGKQRGKPVRTSFTVPVSFVAK